MEFFDVIKFLAKFKQKEKTMHAMRLLHKALRGSLPIHEKRLASLLSASESVVNDGALALTAIGRNMSGAIQVKHKIKKVDRLLGNTKLRAERSKIYETLTHDMLSHMQSITIFIDWSPCGTHKNQLLRASVLVGDNVLPLYEEVHREKNLGKFNVHKIFLMRLKKIIPSSCSVAIVTDAGFRTEWFQLILENEWDFVGRVRSNLLYSFEAESKWVSCKTLYNRAENRPTYAGMALLSKTNEFPAHVYLYDGRKDPEIRKLKYSEKRKIKSGKMEKSYKRCYEDPFIIASSLSGGNKDARRVINIYKKRMKIEHDFRTTKNDKWGFGLSQSRTLDPKRLEILLLVAFLAKIILLLIGAIAEKNNWHHRFQANTIRDIRVLSLVFLAKQVLTHMPNEIPWRELRRGFCEFLICEHIFVGKMV